VDPGRASLKYAQVERERRFLLGGEPPGLDPADGWRIVDRYVDGTRLRLRRMERLDGTETVYKLAKKEVPRADDFSRVTITNIYLTADEHRLLESLPAHELAKRRYKLRDGDDLYSVDVFEGELAGLVLAEISFESDEELAAHAAPAFAVADVSRDERYTGAALAMGRTR
jgi:CYTH domain-containing protein